MNVEQMSNEELANEMDSLDVDPARWEWKDGSHNEYYNRLNEAFEEATERLRTLTALEAKIKGMIERPKVETRFDDNDKKYKLTIHGEPIISSSLGDHNYIYNVAVRIRKALGMEGDK